MKYFGWSTTGVGDIKIKKKIRVNWCNSRLRRPGGLSPH